MFIIRKISVVLGFMLLSPAILYTVVYFLNLLKITSENMYSEDVQAIGIIAIPGAILLMNAKNKEK